MNNFSINKRFDFLNNGDKEIEEVKKEYGLGLSVSELKKAQTDLGREFSITEIYILDSLWSEHCSYKSTKKKLEGLIRENKHAFKTIKGDAGIVSIPGTDYCIVTKIESHNHPTQVSPPDGAATAVGGLFRDLFTMGASILGAAPSIRTFGKEILQGSIEGLVDYCSNTKVPAVDFDIYIDESFDKNVLMNGAALGIVRKDEIIPSIVSKEGVGCNLIYVGKATAGAGFGGASFASQAFEEGEKKEIHFGSNPRLEKITMDIFEALKKEAIKKGFFNKISVKDMGAAGLTCSTVEQVSYNDFGIEINVDDVPTPPGTNILPYVLAVAEDQERNMITAPAGEATETILDYFNKSEDFRNNGGYAVVVGKVTDTERYVLKNKEGNIFCDLPVKLITDGIVYTKKGEALVIEDEKEFSIEEPENLGKEVEKLLSSVNVASRKAIYDYFKTEKSPAYFKTRPGESEAVVIAPLENEEVGEEKKKIGVSLVFGGKSIHGRYGKAAQQAYIATILARLRLAVTGLTPIAMSDGCNYGNPNIPEHYYSFEQGIDGLNKACSIPIEKDTKEPLAVIAGNVSMSNTYISEGKEKEIDPSLIPAVIGYTDNYDEISTIALKEINSPLYLVGERKHEFKGAEYARLFNQDGKNPPSISPEEAAKIEHSIIEAVKKGYIQASKVIENGGLAASLNQMLLKSNLGNVGVEINLENFSNGLRNDFALFSESIGYVIEANKSSENELKELYSCYGLELIPIGRTNDKRSFSAYDKDKKLFEIPIERLEESWNKNLLELI